MPEDTTVLDVAPKAWAAMQAFNKVVYDEPEILGWYPGEYRTVYVREK